MASKFSGIIIHQVQQQLLLWVRLYHRINSNRSPTQNLNPEVSLLLAFYVVCDQGVTTSSVAVEYWGPLVYQFFYCDAFTLINKFSDWIELFYYSIFLAGKRGRRQNGTKAEETATITDVSFVVEKFNENVSSIILI